MTHAAEPKSNTSSLAFLAVAFFTGIGGALQVPTLSLFLDTELHVRPILVGLFYTLNALAGIVIGQALAHWSDQGLVRKRLIILCCVLGAASCILFAFSRNYILLITLGVVFTSLGASTQPQLFALAREHAHHTGREAVMFNSLMRAQISLSWVIGPPIAFALATGLGFMSMYLFATIAFAACAVLTWKYLPAMRRAPYKAKANDAIQGWRDPAVKLLLLATTLMWATNTMYLINMPLYLINELHLSNKLAGYLMGTAAGLEIPIMLIASRLSKRWNKRTMMRFAIIAGICFYLGLSLLTNVYLLFAVQLLNASFIGIIATVGMLYFQDLMPDQAGTATTLFSSGIRCGGIFAGALAGGIAEIWNYHGVFIVAIGLLAVAYGCFRHIKNV